MFSDASTTGIGGALCVCRNDIWMPCSSFSRKLIPRERKFSATELEALALLETVEHFSLYLFTDHQALSGILDGIPSSSKLTRWKLKLADYDIVIEHIKGLHNPIADSLSWQGWSEPDSPSQDDSQ